MIISTGQFRLTDRGEKLYDSYLTGIKVLSPIVEELLYQVGRGLDSTIREDRLKEFSYLLRSGYIEEESASIESLLEDIPQKGDLRSNLDIYIRIAKGEAVSDKEIERLRQTFLEVYKGRPEDEDYLRNPLKEARTRSEKIIAIDSVMSDLHTGNLPISGGGGGIVEDFGFTSVKRVLNRLRYG